jgi:hypothetical protein
MCFAFVCNILFLRGGVLLLLLYHVNRCLPFIITWCVEGYCDMHQLRCLVVGNIVNHLVLFNSLLSELVLHIGFEFSLICPMV